MTATKPAQPPPDIGAIHHGECAACGAPIVAHVTRIGHDRGRPVCVGCVEQGGGDDE